MAREQGNEAAADLVKAAAREFADVFGSPPAYFGCAPGRVEVLGNHTDYNQGVVLAAAIDRHTVICGRRARGDRCRVYARSFNQGDSFSLRELDTRPAQAWLAYVQGVVRSLAGRGCELGGFDALIMSNVPLGAGLSSSAALEVATALFLQQAYPYEMEIPELARACQAAENEFVGVNCGLLDQLSSLMGEEERLIFMDFRFPERNRTIPLGGGVELVLADTRAAHDLAEGTYNRMREECFAAARLLASRLERRVAYLRDVEPEELESHVEVMEPVLARRARHIVGENARVWQAVAALEQGDPARLGRLMLESHASSRDSFKNSCAELDIMVECAQTLPGCLGARLSGGGFGGCTVNLVQSAQVEAFARDLAASYEKKTGISPALHPCRAVAGAHGGTIQRAGMSD